MKDVQRLVLFKQTFINLLKVNKNNVPKVQHGSNGQSSLRLGALSTDVKSVRRDEDLWSSTMCLFKPAGGAKSFEWLSKSWDSNMDIIG